MLAGNLYLLLGAVTVELDEFHAVEQGARYLADVVGRCNKHHLRQVVVHIEEVVVEGGVLLGVEHFEKSRRRVAVYGHSANLVNLVEDENGVVGACLDDVLQDAAGHGTNVGATMAADFGFVVQAAE